MCPLSFAVNEKYDPLTAVFFLSQLSNETQAVFFVVVVRMQMLHDLLAHHPVVNHQCCQCMSSSGFASKIDYMHLAVVASETKR